jgi:hypothetical protein
MIDDMMGSDILNPRSCMMSKRSKNIIIKWYKCILESEKFNRGFSKWESDMKLLGDWLYFLKQLLIFYTKHWAYAGQIGEELHFGQANISVARYVQVMAADDAGSMVWFRY